MQKMVIVVWVVLISVPLSYLMGMHTLTLKSSHDSKLSQLATQNKWTKLHFLGSDCKCSETVLNELLKRGPEKENEEKVFILGKNDEWKKQLITKGYHVIEASMDEFEKTYSIKATPQLVILDDKKTILYSGGYSANRNPSSIDDQVIVDALKGNKPQKERPIFGCVNGTLNRKNTDPLKLKY